MINLFSRYPNGSNLTILNTIYHKSRKVGETWTDDAITLIAKDLDNDKKVIKTIDRPKYEFYVVDDPDYQLEGYYHSTLPKNILRLVECDYKSVDVAVAEELDMKSQFYDNIRMGIRDQNKKMHIDPRIMRSTMNISDFYRYKFRCMYKNEPYPLHKGYLDIEADAAKAVGEFPESGEVPINAVTFIDHWNWQSYTFLLEDVNNPQYYKFKEEYETTDMSIRIWEKIKEAFGGNESKIEKYKLNNLDFKILFYEDEITMLRDLFTVINNSGIDFLMAWNMKFDIPYIIDRIKKLGYNPADIICHPAFKYKECSYFIDENNRDMYHLRTDHATISAPFVYLDQLLMFCGRRKSTITAFPNFKLDTIANLCAGMHKLDYSHITRSLPQLPMLAYDVFAIYNIVDVIAQIVIEESEGDINYVFAMALETNTRYSKIYKPSITEYNTAIYYYEKNYGLICGNNKNQILGTPKESFDGAYVSEQRLLGDQPKLRLNGTPIMVCDNVCDEDFAAMYPSELRNFNMSDATQIGRIKIPKQVWEGDDHLHMKATSIIMKSKTKEPSKYNRGGHYIEDISTGNWLIFGSRWLGLKDFDGLLDDVVKYLTQINPTQATVINSKHQIVVPSETAVRRPWYIDLGKNYKLKNNNYCPYRIVLPMDDKVREALMNDFVRRKVF